jgi:transcriptional antiterminator RfaH
MTSSLTDEAAWYCVKTQTKREHYAAHHLRELPGVEVFCPRLRYRKATRRGKIWWLEALFPGYVLARFVRTESERAVTYSQGVRGLVRFGAEIPAVSEAFVATLRAEWAEENDETVTLTPTVQPGEEVEVAIGPLRGMRGTVVSVLPAAERVKILLEFLGQQHPVDIDLFSILLPGRPVP